MNPLYIALPLFLALVWGIAVIAVKHDKKVRDRETHAH
jgi:hypothetical protein